MTTTRRKSPEIAFPCPSCGRPGMIARFGFEGNGQNMTIAHPYIAGVPGQGPTDPCELDDAATAAFVQSWPEVDQ